MEHKRWLSTMLPQAQVLGTRPPRNSCHIRSGRRSTRNARICQRNRLPDPSALLAISFALPRFWQGDAGSGRTCALCEGPARAPALFYGLPSWARVTLEQRAESSSWLCLACRTLRETFRKARDGE